MLCINNLSFSYRKSGYILRDINIQINPGVNILLGKNGAGKTTLLKVLAGISKSSSEISLNGISISDKSYLDHIAYLPQDFSLYENLKVCEIIELVAAMKKIKKAERQDLINMVLQQANISEYRNTFFANARKARKKESE